MAKTEPKEETYPIQKEYRRPDFSAIPSINPNNPRAVYHGTKPINLLSDLQAVFTG